MARGLDFDDVEKLLEDAAREPHYHPKGADADKERKRKRSRSRSRSPGQLPQPKPRDRDRDRDRDREDREERRREDLRKREEEEERQKVIEDATRGDRTVMVASLPLKADERDLYEFFSKPGYKVRDVQIIRDARTGRSKGVGYIEFASQEFAMKALALNGHSLRGHNLVIQPSHAERNRLDSARLTGASANTDEARVSMANPETNLGRPPPPPPLLQLDEDVGQPSRFLALQGVFSSSEVDLKADPNFYKELEEEIAEECAKYGRPKAVRASRGRRESTVWIRFGKLEDAASCQKALDRRWFGGKQIKARFVPETAYAKAGGT